MVSVRCVVSPCVLSYSACQTTTKKGDQATPHVPQSHHPVRHQLLTSAAAVDYVTRAGVTFASISGSRRTRIIAPLGLLFACDLSLCRQQSAKWPQPPCTVLT